MFRWCRLLRRSTAGRVICALLAIFTGLSTNTVYAQAVVKPPVAYMPAANQLLKPGERYELPRIIGMRFDTNNPFLFNFAFSRGDIQLEKNIIRREVVKCNRYFLAALALPEKELWVNLSPYEPGRISSVSLGMTDLGKDMLAEDYVLKQLAASLTHPDTETGRKYWSTSVPQKAKGGELTRTGGDFQKVWIVPGKIRIAEAQGMVAIEELSLKVVSEADYLALQQNSVAADTANAQAAKKRWAELLPVIEDEVNNGKYFAHLRQIYSALVMAAWFKKKLRDTIFGQVYLDHKKTKGSEVSDPAMREKIYNEYVKAFQSGVYNLVKTERAGMKLVKKAYFCGGIAGGTSKYTQSRTVTSADIARIMQQGIKNNGRAPMGVRSGLAAPIEVTQRCIGLGESGSQRLADITPTNIPVSGVAPEGTSDRAEAAAQGAKNMAVQTASQRSGIAVISPSSPEQNITNIGTDVSRSKTIIPQGFRGAVPSRGQEEISPQEASRAVDNVDSQPMAAIDDAVELAVEGIQKNAEENGQHFTPEEIEILLDNMTAGAIDAAFAPGSPASGPATDVAGRYTPEISRAVDEAIAETRQRSERNRALESLRERAAQNALKEDPQWKTGGEWRADAQSMFEPLGRERGLTVDDALAFGLFRAHKTGKRNEDGTFSLTDLTKKAHIARAALRAAYKEQYPELQGNELNKSIRKDIVDLMRAGVLGEGKVPEAKPENTGGLDFARVDEMDITVRGRGLEFSIDEAVDFLKSGKMIGMDLEILAIKY